LRLEEFARQVNEQEENRKKFVFEKLIAGTAVELKHNYGLSYNIHIQTKDSSIAAITNLVHSFCADAPVVDRLDGALTFRIQPSQVSVLGQLLGALEGQREQGEHDGVVVVVGLSCCGWIDLIDLVD
jgi:hypothetical protein